MQRKGTLKGIQSDKMKAEFQSVFQLVLFRFESWNNNEMDEDQLLQEAYSNYQPSDIEEAKKMHKCKYSIWRENKQYEYLSDNIRSYYGTGNC